MSKATPTPAPTAGHEMRRSTGGAYVAMYAPDSRTPIMPSSSHAAVCLLTLPDTRLRGSLAGAAPLPQAPSGIGDLGLSKEETRIVPTNTMHSHT